MFQFSNVQDQTTVKIYENPISLVHENSEAYHLSKSDISRSGSLSLFFIE